jgi:dTDP-4-amino-4,6-dideoxy-D-galactose acyltransferase
VEVATVSRFAEDRWLAQIFHGPVFRWIGAADERCATGLTGEMARLSGSGRAFFYAKVPTNNVLGCSALCRAGFAVIDTAITLARADGLEPGGGGVSVGIATREQRVGIPAIAESCFRWSRFHLDPQIPTAVANEVKRRWIESYVQGLRGSALYAAETDGRLAGFLAVLELSLENRRIAVIDLVGVTPEHQGKGVGAALVRFFVNDWQGRAGELRVGTQAANIRSLRLYERFGFRVVESTYVLHAHYRQGKLHR